MPWTLSTLPASASSSFKNSSEPRALSGQPCWLRLLSIPGRLPQQRPSNLPRSQSVELHVAARSLLSEMLVRHVEQPQFASCKGCLDREQRDMLSELSPNKHALPTHALNISALTLILPLHRIITLLY